MADELNLSDEFASEWTAALLSLNSFTGNTRRRVLSLLRQLQDDLVAEIARADLEGVARDSARRTRLERLLEDANDLIDSRYDTAGKRLRTELRELGSLVHETSVSILNKVFTVNLVTVTMNIAELRALTDQALVLGEPTKDWWKGQAEQTRRRFAREMRLGIIAGETNEQLVQRVRGRATGRTLSIELADGTTRRVREFTDGIMAISTRDADRLVRTSTQSVSNEVILETYRQNKDILRGVAALTTLDNRTSHICIARTGAAWDLEGNPLPESSVQERFPGPPPWHFYCRTVLIPITKSWEQLAEEATGKKKKLLNTVPDSVRASMDGLVPGRIRTFDEWLRIKGDTFARTKLGPGLFELWKQGKITLSQLIDQSGRPRSLGDIRRSLGLAG